MITVWLVIIYVVLWLIFVRLGRIARALEKIVTQDQEP